MRLSFDLKRPYEQDFRNEWYILKVKYLCIAVKDLIEVINTIRETQPEFEGFETGYGLAYIKGTIHGINKHTGKPCTFSGNTNIRKALNSPNNEHWYVNIEETPFAQAMSILNFILWGYGLNAAEDQFAIKHNGVFFFKEDTQCIYQQGLKEIGVNVHFID